MKKTNVMKKRLEPAWACVVLALGCSIDGGQSGTDGLEVDQGNAEEPEPAADDAAAEPSEPEPAASSEPMSSEPSAEPSPVEPSPVEPAQARENLPSDWLAFCGGKCAEGLSCVCGVCTLPCEEASDCTDLSDAADCMAPDPAVPNGCYGSLHTQTCELSCAEDADCQALSTNHVCDLGRCRGPALGWIDSLCDEPPAIAIPECKSDERLRPSDYCESLACVSFDPRCVQTNGVVLDCATEPVVQWDATLGRCEHVDSCQVGAFLSMADCWQSCEASNYGMCLEDWLPLQGEQTAEINGVSAAEVEAALERDFSATARFVDGTESAIHLELSDVRVYEVVATPNPNFTLEILPSCFTTQVAEASARFYTDDGRLDEAWHRLRLDVTIPEEITFRVQVRVPETDGNPQDAPVLTGTYAPEPDPEHCLLITAISGSIEGDFFHGELFNTRSTRACGDPLGAVTSDGGGGPANGPVW